MSGGSFHRVKLAARLARDEIRRKAGPWPFVGFPAPLPTVPPETIACHRGLFEADQLDRVTGCGFESTLDYEIAKLEATQFVESPMNVHRLGPATIIGGRILTDHAAHLLSFRNPLTDLARDPVELPTARLVNMKEGLSYFGHWLGDDCPMRETLRGAEDAVSMILPDWPDRRIYMSAFDQTWPELGHARVGDLTVYREIGFNRDKAARFRILRDRLRAGRGGERGDGGERIVYLGRGRSGTARDMANRDAFEAAMDAAGIRVLIPETDGGKLVDGLLDATMIVTIEGSQACHAIYSLAEGGSLLILQPPDRFYNPHHEWTRLMGQRYGTVIGEQDAPGFTIRPDEVFAMIDRLLAAPRRLDA